MLQFEWNPWHGCHKIEDDCNSCIMYHTDEVNKLVVSSDVVRKTNMFDYPLQKDNKGNYKIKSGSCVRVNVMSDTFIEEADAWRDDMWSIIKQRSDVIFWIVTKRPERIKVCLPSDWCDGYDNVRIDIMCENQYDLDVRVPILLASPVKYKGIYLSPLSSFVDITIPLMMNQILEVNVSGDVYDSNRPCDYMWVRNIAEVCQKYSVNFNWLYTGANLICDCNNYYIDDVTEQSAQADKAGLNQKYYDLYNI